MNSHELHFNEVVAAEGCRGLFRTRTTTLQINLGRLCNQTCTHCHVGAGPTESKVMSAAVADRAMELLAASPGVRTVDITGGAPELSSVFRQIVTSSKSLRRDVMVRSNLTVFHEPGMQLIPDFLAEHHAEIIASLPCYLPTNVDAQRGYGVFEKSVRALKRLNQLGYGMPGSSLRLSLAYSPTGATLPPSQSTFENEYRHHLLDRYGIEFHRLLTITNMPIRRFADVLRRRGEVEGYFNMLINNFNRCTLSDLMCRSLVSVGYDGQLYDCDFNQMVGIPMGGKEQSILNADSLDSLEGKEIATGRHCFGCTAGSGSSCGGSLQVQNSSQ